MPAIVTSMLWPLATVAPLVIVYAVGWSLQRRLALRYPLAARRLRAAVLIDVSGIVFSILATALVRDQQTAMAWPVTTLSMLFGAITVVSVLFHTVAAALLLAAILAERKVPSTAADPASEVPAPAGIPWYRRQWFVGLSFLVFMPATLAIVLSGEVYATRDGRPQPLPAERRYLIAGAALVLMALALLRAMSAAQTPQ